MKKRSIILIALILSGINLKAQENEKLKIITGVRVNPFVMFDNTGN